MKKAIVPFLVIFSLLLVACQEAVDAPKEVDVTVELPSLVEPVKSTLGVSFDYDAEKYVLEDGRLWGVEVMQIKNEPYSDFPPLMDVEEGNLEDRTLEEYVIDDLELGDVKTLDVVSALSDQPLNWGYEQITLGGNDFLKINISGKYQATYYFTSKADRALSFATYSLSNVAAVEEIIATLKW